MEIPNIYPDTQRNSMQRNHLLLFQLNRQQVLIHLEMQMLLAKCYLVQLHQALFQQQ